MSWAPFNLFGSLALAGRQFHDGRDSVAQIPFRAPLHKGKQWYVSPISCFRSIWQTLLVFP